MLFDSLMLHAVVTDLRGRLVGRRVTRVFQTSRAQTVLEVRASEPPGQLVLSACPTFGRIHLDDEWEPNPTVSFPFGAVLQRWLRSAVIADIEQRKFDRAVRISFANARALGPQSRCVLVLETMGRLSNALLTDADGIILEAVTHVTRDRNRYRQILPGEQYVPPPTFGKHHPGALSAEEIAATVPDADASAGTWLRETFQGISDVFRAEALCRAGLGPDVRAGELRAEDFDALHTAFADLLAEAEASRGWLYDCGKECFAYPVRLQSRPECTMQAAPDIHGAIARVAASGMVGADVTQLRRRLQDAVARASATVRKRIAEREDYVQRARDAGTVRRTAEALLTYGHLIPRGASLAEVPDPYAQGGTLHIALDPALNPQANAQRYFARYRKLSETERRVTLFLKSARVEMEYLDGLADQIERSSETDDLRLIEEELLAQGYLRRRDRRSRREQPREPGAQLPQASVEGYTVLWGKSGLQNDRLLRAAGPDDIWLHAQRTPGGHVLIRSQGTDGTVPDSVLMAAAQHAASLSKRYRDSRVSVDYTHARHVRRIKGTPPGYVHYTQQRTLNVAPTPLRGRG